MKSARRPEERRTHVRCSEEADGERQGGKERERGNRGDWSPGYGCIIEAAGGAGGGALSSFKSSLSGLQIKGTPVTPPPDKAALTFTGSHAQHRNQITFGTEILV